MTIDNFIIEHLGESKLVKILDKYDRCYLDKRFLHLRIFGNSRQAMKERRRCYNCIFANDDLVCYFTNEKEYVE